VQINGKVRGRVTVPASATDQEIEAAALEAPAIQPYLTGRQVVKVIVARGRLVSIVVK
jgi:leucyl-tRNA synthetase